MNNLVRSTIMVIRGTVGLQFENGAGFHRLRLRTSSGSTYSVELPPSLPSTRRLGDANYTMRQGNVIINGRRYNDVLIGYSPKEGVLLVLDPVDSHVIRQSTGITKSEPVN